MALPTPKPSGDLLLTCTSPSTSFSSPRTADGSVFCVETPKPTPDQWSVSLDAETTTCPPATVTRPVTTAPAPVTPATITPRRQTPSKPPRRPL